MMKSNSDYAYEYGFISEEGTLVGDGCYWMMELEFNLSDIAYEGGVLYNISLLTALIDELDLEKMNLEVILENTTHMNFQAYVDYSNHLGYKGVVKNSSNRSVKTELVRSA